MSKDGNPKVGLSKRDLERELKWMMRNTPTDPAQLAVLLGQVIVALIDKNNAELAARIDAGDDGKPGAP